MSVLSRMAIWLLAGGLLAGIVVRATLGRRRFRAVLAVTLVVPAVIHAGYVTVQALVHSASVWGVLAFLAGGAVVVAAGWWTGRRWTPRHGLWAAFVPALTGAAYGALPFGLYSLALRQQGIDLDILPTAVYLGACLFATALLLPFAPAGGASWSGLLGSFRRRR